MYYIPKRGKSYNSSMALRIDLTDYQIYIQALQDKLNEDGVYRMSMTCAVKIAIEKALASLVPDVQINKTRKKYINLPF
jgi:hypothetical protein